jgi:hypothetical protein
LSFRFTSPFGFLPNFIKSFSNEMMSL